MLSLLFNFIKTPQNIIRLIAGVGVLVTLIVVYSKGKSAGERAAQVRAEKQVEKISKKAEKGSKILIKEHKERSSALTKIDRNNQERINAIPSDNSVCLSQSDIKRLRLIK